MMHDPACQKIIQIMVQNVFFFLGITDECFELIWIICTDKQNSRLCGRQPLDGGFKYILQCLINLHTLRNFIKESLQNLVIVFTVHFIGLTVLHFLSLI